jgi:uncharacterized membrane protein
MWCLSLWMYGEDITFKASAPGAVAMGEQFRLTYTVNAEGRELRIPDLSDFDVLMGPSTSTNVSTQYVNGQMSSVYTQTFTYILMAKKEGVFSITPATIKVKNANYTSNVLSIKVLPPNTNAGESSGAQSESTSGIGREELFVNMLVSDRSVYEQEGFLVTFKIYSLVDVANIGNIKFPEFEGFLAQDVEVNAQWALENYNGRNYRTAVIKQTILYPQRSGKITIESGHYDAIVRVRTQKRVRSIFEDFFDTYQDVRKELVSPPVTVDVKPLPPGKPASFSGAVGNYTMKTSINALSLKANEAVTITVTLAGTGNLKLAKNPEVMFPNDFEVYDPKVDIKTKTTTGGTSGTKTVEYMAIPRFGGDFEIPSIQFSYFDPKEGVYKTLSSEPFELHVEQGAGVDGGSSPVVTNFGGQQNIKLLGQDIRYIKVSKPHFVSVGGTFFGSLTYILIYAVLSLLFVIFFIIYRKQRKESANLALVRTKKANKTAVRRLKRAGVLLKSHEKESFYEEVLRALWGYLSDKLNIPQASLTKDNVEQELLHYGVEVALVGELMEIVRQCEEARYAPVSDVAAAMDQLYHQTVWAIGRMESTIKK